MYGFVRCAAAVPKMKVADCVYNVKEIIAMIETASNKDVDLLGFSGTLHNRLHMLGFVFTDISSDSRGKRTRGYCRRNKR